MNGLGLCFFKMNFLYVVNHREIVAFAYLFEIWLITLRKHGFSMDYQIFNFHLRHYENMFEAPKAIVGSSFVGEPGQATL